MSPNIHFPEAFPIIETERLRLSSFDQNDTEHYFKLRSDNQFIKYLSTYPMTLSDAKLRIKETIEDFDKKRGLSWKISLKKDSNLIGYLGFWRIDQAHFRAEVGFGIDLSYQGKGLMSEAMKAILNYGFHDIRIHSVLANVDVNNAASINLLKRLGFKKEAHFREDYFFDGKFLDSIHYCLLEKDIKF